MKLFIPFLCVVFLILGLQFSVEPDCPIQNRFLYMFSHGNVLHLALNLYTYYLVYKILQFSWSKFMLLFLFFGLVSGLAAIHPAVGMSGALYGMIGVLAVKLKYNIKQIGIVLITIAITVLLPRISWEIHLFGFILGYLTSKIYGGIHGYGRKACLGAL